VKVSGVRRVVAMGASLFALGICCGPAWAHWKAQGARDAPRAHAADGGAGVTVTTVAQGLDNPRGLTFGTSGELFVAEAGNGAEPGSKECVPSGPEGNPEEQTCVGFTSSVSMIDRRGVHKVIGGLVSLAEPDGSFATGVSGVTYSMWGLQALEQESAEGVPPAASEHLSAATLAKGKEQLGRLFQVRSGRYRVIADVGDFDSRWALEHKSLVPEQFPDADPYAALGSAEVTWIIDAASNTLGRVSPFGSVSVTTFFPSPPVSDAVPTCIARGADGAFYVSQLGGVFNPAGIGVVWRVVPGHEPEVWARGLTSVTGCGFGPEGQFYAVELSNKPLLEAAPGTGEVVRVPAHSTSPITVVENLSFPGGFAANRRTRSLYVSNWSVAPSGGALGATGEVLQISLGTIGHG